MKGDDGLIIEPRIKNNVEDRSFGKGIKLIGLNALANYYLNSLTFSTTSTTYYTLTSTLTVQTIVSCYTRTMFTSTTPCRRRKRKLFPGILIGDDTDHSNQHPVVAPTEKES